MFSLQNQFCNGFKFVADFVQEVIHRICNSPITRSSDLVMQVESKTVERVEIFPKQIRNILSHRGVTFFLGQELSNKPLAA